MRRRDLKWILGSLIGTFLFLLADMIGDYQEGADLGHFLIEVLSLFFISAGIFFLFRSLKNMTHDFKAKSLEASTWRSQHAKLVEGLGNAIDEQLNQWSLSPAEKEIARLLLKGFSFKEMAVFRGTSEKTIRQQAQNIYSKAALPGRAELSAFFLEDLLNPVSSH